MARAMTGHPRARPRLASCLAVLTVAFLLTAVPTLALPPTLTQFGLDLSLDRVELVFSEPVNISTFDANAWFLTSNATTNEEQLYLTDGVISSPDGGTTLYLNLSTATVDGLASREQLGRTTQSTFVNADNAGVTDLQAEDWQTLAQGKPPDYIVPDIEGPVITSATLNMSNGDVFFALSETVDETSFLATWASILCLERAQYVTTVKANVTTVTTRQGRATISARDLNVLKLLQCATIVLTTVVNAFDDQFQNAHEAANVTMFTFPDTTSPELTAFDLNMTSGELVLEFSEPVLASSLDLSALVLANDTDAAFAVRTALDNGTASAVDGTQLRITLSVSVVDAIKLAANTAQAAAATFLDASGALVADMAGQPSVAVAALPVRVLAPDAVAPVLVSYGVRMDQARPPIVLTLVFSEPVDVGALNHTALVFQSNATAATSAESYRLQHAPAAVVPSSSQRQVAIELATGDFLALRDAAGLAVLMRSAATTYLRFDPVLVTDTIGSSVVGVSAVDGAVAPSEYTVDLVPPQLSAFDVDMDAGFVVLRFSEDVNASSIAVGAFSLVAARGANVTAEGVTFDAALDAASSTGNATQVRIDLSVSTLNRVKADAGLAVSRSTSFLAVAAGGIADFAGNSMRQVASASAVAAVSYVADATGPVLQSFALNMTSGVLRLTFDEVVARATFDATQARLVNAATGATVAVALDAVAVDAPAANSTTLGFTLTQAAANEVRARTGLGTTVDNTYLQLLAGAIRDAAGNANLPVTANATQVVQDALPARLLALSLNMDSGVLSLSYSEPVQALTLVPAAITLARAANSTSTYTLAHSTVVTSGYTQVVDVALGAEDITALKLAGICLFQDACAVSANGTLVQDATGAFVPAVADAEINDVFVADQTAPALADRGFLYFDLNNGTIALSFTEVVNVTSARPTRITLQSFFESPEASYTLTGGRVLGGYHSGPGSTVVLIALSTSDLNAVKSNPDICRARSTCYLSATAGVVDDLNANSAHPISETEPFVAAQAFVADTTAPGLVSFGIDMEAGTVALTFDESIDSVSLQATGMTLQTAMWASGAAYSANHTLTGGSVTVLSSTTLELALLTADVQRLKALDLCLGAAANCTLSAAGGFVQDLALSPNEALAISRAAALNASAIVADVTSPRIAAFTLDVDVGTLLVTFNEPVRGESFDPTGLTVQAARTSAIESVTLTGGAVSLVRAEAGDVGSRVVRVDLLQDDTVSLKLNLNLATAQADTYLSATNATVQDMSGNWNAPVPTNDARPSSVYQRDETPAALVSYELDMLAGTLSLTFSDVVDVSTLRVQSIALVNAGTSYALQSSTTNSTDGLYVVIDLSVEDLLGVLRVPGLARTRDTTFLTMDATALDDFAGLDVAVVTSDSPQQALAFVADTAAPALVSFDFNLTAGDLALTFSEPVNASTVDFARIQLRAAANATDAALTLSLTGGALTQSADDRVLYVRMTAADFLALQAKRALATNASTTFVFVDGLLDDYFGNTLAAADATAQQVAVFGEDTRAPTLVSVSLDLDARTMSMVFSETMDSASFEPSVVRFACGNATSSDFGDSSVQLSHDDATALSCTVPVSALRFIYEQCFSADLHSVVVLVSSDLAQDTAGNQVRRMAGVEVQIVLDQTSPAIASLSMDLNIGDMTVRFDEPIMEVSLNASCIAVQSLVNASLPAVLLANSSAETLYGQQEALVTLGPYDLNQLKGLVWKSGSANLSAQICVAFGVDLAQNPSVSRTLNVTVSSLDETAPEVISASLNLTSGIVQLVIDEPVVATSLDVTKLEVGGGIRGSVVRLNASTLLHAQDSALRTVLQLRVPDLVLDQLKFLVAGSEGDVVIGIESGAMVDASDNEIQASVGNDSVAFSQIAVDTAAPAISEFRVNLNASTISISMTEPIDASAGILTDKLRLLVDNVLLLRPQRMPVSVSNYARSLTFTLSSDDANLVKAALARAGLVSTIQLTAEPSFCVDLFSNALQRISTPLNASVVVSDVSAPNLLQFGYDNGRGLVRLQFSEPVDLSTVNISAAALTNANGSFTVGLENSTILGSNNNTWVTLKLANAEHWTVQTTAAIGSDVNSTFLLVPNATIVKDVFGNALVAEDLRGGVRVQATFVVPDTVAPSLVSGSLNMATGVLQLRLSEPVSIDSFNLTRLVLHNSKNRDDSTAKLVLSDSVALRSVTQPTEVKVALSQRELDAVKVDRTLAVNTSTAWFTLEAGAVQDYAKVPNERTEGLLIAELVPDSVKPVLVASYLNMTSLELALIFSEPVASRSINTSLISLAGDRGVPAARTVTLAGASVVGQLLSRRAMINLHGHVAFAIQADLGVATSRNDSVLRLAEGFVIDTSGNAIAFQEAVVTDFTPDERAPLATAAALDLDALTLNITFDEVVRTCNLTSIFVSDAENASSAGRVPLVGSNASFSLNILRVELSQAVANALKSHETVCRSPTSCYVVLGRGSVADASENQVADVQPVLVLPYVQDRTPPTITAFALDVEAGELRLRFDEPVDVSAANASLSSLNMSLQSVPSASFAPSPLVVNLRSPLSVQAVGGLFGQRYALEMNVSIARSVIDDVKRAYPLASSTQQTFLAVGGGAFRDARGNPSNAIDAEKALVVERLHPDLVAPVLLATSIDFAAESIVLTFDEPVNSSSLALAGISAIGGLGRVALQVTDVQPAHGTVVVEATLADESLAWLKLSAVELQQGGVAVELRTGAIRDWNGNQVRQTAQALKLDSADSTASRLLAFNVTWTDENVGVTLVFDEPVNTTTLGLESVLTLSNCSRDGSQISTVVHAAALHGGFVPGGNESSAVFVSGANATSIRYEQDGVAIAIADSMAEEMQFARVCLARDACCLGLTAGFVQNHFRVASAPVSLNETARPSVLEPDVSRPTLVGFVVLDLNSRELVLSFSEPMDETSLNATQLKLEGAAFPGHTSDVLVLSEPERVDVGASGTLLTLTLSLEDAAGIKLRSSLCVSAASCWLRLMDGAIMDASGNAVVGIEPSTASDPERDTPLLVLDNTGPSVLEFSLNLDAGTFGVRFDEPVARDSIDSRLGSISANGNSTSWDVQLRGSVLSSSADLRSFTLSLEEGDANGIKALAAAGLCTTPASCFLRTDNGFAADVFGNDNSAQSAVPVGTLIGDATGPELTEVALLDLTRGILELEFNEPVNASSLDVSRIVLVNATAGGSAPASFVGSLRLSEAPLRVSYRDGATKTGLVVALSSAQLEAISTRLDIAVSQDTSYAFMDAGAVQDMAGNLLANRTSALACTSYVSAGRASIVGVELDLDEGVLKLTLSAAVSAQSLRAEELRLQNVGDADAATQAGTLVSHTLLAASSNTNSRDGFSVTVILAEEDLNAIKGQRALATSRNNTFLVASGEALTGLDGAAILAVVRGAALQATRVVADGTPPALVGFNFSRELGVIDLSFSEVVDVAMLNASALTLTATNATDTASFTVPAGSRVSVPAGANVGSGALQATVKLSEQALWALKTTQGVGEAIASSRLVAAAGFVADMAGNRMVALARRSALVATAFEGDATPPELLSFNLNMTALLLTLNMSEPVPRASLQEQHVALLASATAPIGVTLDGGVVGVELSAYDTIVTVKLSAELADAIHSVPGLCLSADSCFLSAGSAAATDTAANALVATTGLRVSVFARDSRAPVLLGFELDMTAEVLVLTFDKVLNTTELARRYVTLPSSVILQSNDTALTLSGSRVVDAGVSRRVNITLSSNDAFQVQLSDGIGRTTADTFLALNAGTGLTDVSGNEVLATGALQAKTVRADTRRPRLVSYEVDMTLGSLVLVFTEPVRVSSVDATALTLVGAGGGRNVTLRGGNVRGDNGLRIELRMTRGDLDAVKASGGLFANASNTGLLMAAHLCDDMAGNALEPVLAPLQASAFVQDVNQPLLVEFDLNMNSRVLTLVFNESVDVGTLNVSAIVLEPNSSSAAAGSGHRLQGGHVAGTDVLARRIDVALESADVDVLTQKRIAVSRERAWLSHASGLVQDRAGRRAVARGSEGSGVSALGALLCANFTTDTTAPVLVDFTLSLTSNELWLTFSETVVGASLDLSRVVLQNVTNATANTFPVVTTVTTANGPVRVVSGNELRFEAVRLGSGSQVADGQPWAFPVLRVELAFEDVERLRASLSLAVSRESTFLRYDAEAFSDVFAQRAGALTADEAAACGAFERDGVAPRVVAVGVDLSQRGHANVTLEFSETVDVQSLQVTAISFLNITTGALDAGAVTLRRAGTGVQQEGGFILAGYGRHVSLSLSAADLQALQLRPSLVATQNRTLVQVAAGAVTDTAGNAISATEAFVPVVFLSDESGPVLDAFELDMDDGVLVLTFDEVVAVDTFDVSAVVLLSNASVDVVDRDGRATSNETWFRLTPDSEAHGWSGSSLSADLLSTQIAVVLGADDLNELKARRSVASNAATSVLVLAAGAVADGFGNTNEAIHATRNLQPARFVADVTGPVLRRFALDMNEALLEMTFDEPVLASSLNASLLVIQGVANSALAGATQLRLGTNGTKVSYGATALVLRMALADADVYLLKARGGLATARASTYLRADAGFVRDTASNAAVGTPHSTALGVSSDFVADSVPPALLRFTFDLDSAVVQLTFSEPVASGTLDATKMFVAGAPLSTGGDTGYRAASETAGAEYVEMHVLRVDLTGAFIGTLKLDAAVATAQENTWLVGERGFVRDMQGNQADPEAGVMAAGYHGDDTRPSVAGYVIDMTSGMLTLTFDDVVNARSFDRSGLSFVPFSDEGQSGGGGTDQTSVVALEP